MLTSSCAPPSTSKVFVFNATVVPSGRLLRYRVPIPAFIVSGAFRSQNEQSRRPIGSDNSISLAAANRPQLLLPILSAWKPE